MQPRYGGSFAPPLDADKLAAYRELAASASPAVKAAVEELCVMAQAHLGQPPPEAHGAATPHPSGVGLARPLAPAHREAVAAYVPWPHLTDALAVLFDGIDNATQKPLRDAAHHLLWYAKELQLGRHPLTNDRLGA